MRARCRVYGAAEGLDRTECLRRRKSLGQTLGTLIDGHLDFLQIKVRELSSVVTNRAQADRGVSPIDASAVRYVTVLVGAYDSVLSGLQI